MWLVNFKPPGLKEDVGGGGASKNGTGPGAGRGVPAAVN